MCVHMCKCGSMLGVHACMKLEALQVPHMHDQKKNGKASMCTSSQRRFKFFRTCMIKKRMVKRTRALQAGGASSVSTCMFKKRMVKRACALQAGGASSFSAHA
jgi:hypothetical protein